MFLDRGASRSATTTYRSATSSQALQASGKPRQRPRLTRSRSASALPLRLRPAQPCWPARGLPLPGQSRHLPRGPPSRSWRFSSLRQAYGTSRRATWTWACHGACGRRSAAISPPPPSSAGSRHSWPGLLSFLAALVARPSIFTFGREALTVRDHTLSGIAETLSIPWDSVERITMERKDSRAEYSYSIIARFRPGLAPFHSELKKHGGKHHRDGSYIVYRTSRFFSFMRGEPSARGGVQFSRLNEAFPKYAGQQYAAPWQNAQSVTPDKLVGSPEPFFVGCWGST